jgi:hypothetical protein
MAKFKINAGVDIETATPAEVKGLVDASQQAWFHEMARGMKQLYPAAAAAVSSGALDLVGANAQGDPLWPDQGMCWRVNRLTVSGLGTGDSLSLWRIPEGGVAASPGPQPGARLVDLLTTARPAIYPGKGLILQPGQALELTGASLTATQVTVNLDVTEVPAFMVWKLF